MQQNEKKLVNALLSAAMVLGSLAGSVVVYAEDMAGQETAEAQGENGWEYKEAELTILVDPDTPKEGYEAVFELCEEKTGIHIETEIQVKVSNYLNESKENAGLWIGMVDEKLHRITVVDTYIPPDNKRQKNNVTMGKQGVRDYIKDITTKTNGLLQYVGEWHTHTIGNGTPSSIDLKTFAETKPSNIAFLMTIFAPLKTRHWVIQEKE